ncbi:hypothetical protein [Methanobacterium alcaliphilum]|uniref:hypothetical protein n=1 Tax=Methanobacterium alcaliphilum TaxID=392018 RepID=UPI00200ADD5D|nr:hypothetical protein [Methanobacterium alcaliphilum]MCK9151040.1 hypothetical protein [Methanobacterium alcaliphilum]
MGQLFRTLNEFSEVSNKYYEKIRDILENEYCWKCPQRSTSNIISCKEVDAWIRLIMALEDGLKSKWIKEGYSKTRIQTIQGKFMEKKSLKSRNQKRLIIRLNEDKKPYCKKGEYIVLKEEFFNIKKDDLVLVSQICPLAKYFYLKIDFMDTPFKIEKVKRVFYEHGIKYIEFSDESRIECYKVQGPITNIFSKKDAIDKELHLK